MISLKFVFIIILSCAARISCAQVYYEIEPIKAYLSFYRNGESLYVLNDSINTSLFKKNDSTFSIKFFVNRKFKQECYCEYKGVTKEISVRMLVSEKGKKKFRREKRTVKELVLKERSCIDFLPKEVFVRENNNRDGNDDTTK